MKGILLIGKYNIITRKIKAFLSKNFDVQLSSDNFKIIKGMLEAGDYDLIILNLVGWDKEKTIFFKEINKNCVQTPVICVGADMELAFAQQYLQIAKLHMLRRPIVNKSFFDIVCTELHVNIPYIASKEDEIEKIGYTRNGRKKILLVDDSPIQLRALREILKTKYDVFIAASGKDAMTIMDKQKPDLVFLDYEMPVCNGKMFFEIIRSVEETKNIPVVFLTGVNDREHIQDVLSLNPEGYLLKPVTKERLLQTVEEMIGE